jgi:hypothetical protein
MLSEDEEGWAEEEEEEAWQAVEDESAEAAKLRK